MINLTCKPREGYKHVFANVHPVLIKKLVSIINWTESHDSILDVSRHSISHDNVVHFKNTVTLVNLVKFLNSSNFGDVVSSLVK